MRADNAIQERQAHHQIIAGGSGGELHRWWTGFRAKWNKCVRCPLHKGRTNVVQFRGIIPAPILFVGEAPWISEDEIGRPFCGPAGRELDKLIDQAGIEDGEFCIVNVVACIPRGEDGPRPPENAEARACSPRLQELIQHVAPKLVVRLGNVAAKYVDPFLNGQPVLDLVHPSYIIQLAQKSTARADLARKRFTLTLKQWVERMRLPSG